LLSPDKRDIVPCEVNKRARGGGEILDPDVNSPCGAKKTTDLGLAFS